MPQFVAAVVTDSLMLFDGRGALVHSLVPGLHFRRLCETIRRGHYEIEKILTGVRRELLLERESPYPPIGEHRPTS